MFEAGPGLVNRARRWRATLGHGLTSAGRLLERRAWQLLVPGVCALCGGGPIQWERCRGGLDLCEWCEAALPRTAGAGGDGALPPPGCDHVLAPFAYAPPADHMVRQLKFAGERAFARVLGQLLAEAGRAEAGRRGGGGPLPDFLVPVPLHWSRLRERGFNQAEEIARFAARPLRLPVRPRMLQRLRATAAQSGLHAAERRGNLAGAFRASGLPAGARVALVDDVLTTGSTAAAAAAALREGGATRVELWVGCRA